MTLSGHASQSSIYGTTIAFTMLAALVVVARLITRIAIVRRPGLDDAFITLGCVFSVAMGVSICKQAEYGMGLHWHTLPKSYMTRSVAWYWAFVWLYYAASAFTKLSILLQYLRIFPHDQFRKACFVLIGSVSVWSAWTVLSAIFMCGPIASFWNMDIFSWGQAHCLPRMTIWYLNAAVNIFTDCAVFLLPLPIIHSLEIPRKQNTCIISVLRLIYIYPISTESDVTWNSPLAAIWSCVEIDVGILCACIPTLKGCVQRFFPKLLDSIRSSPVGSENSAQTQDSVEKIKIEVNGKETKSPVASLHRWKPSFSRSNYADYRHSSRGSDAGSEEAIVGMTRSHGTARSSLDRGIEVVTIVDQTSEQRKSNLDLSKAVRGYGSNQTLVSGAGRLTAGPDLAPSTTLPVDERLYAALGYY
ncbi:hypothetical protein LTR85_011748 [Meristemomyces frigidus]|nr:hypothetical protein LTR85_011748 [Meristemomyces frigidus]